jgi:ketosteroid isomerase-like protein
MFSRMKKIGFILFGLIIGTSLFGIAQTADETKKLVDDTNRIIDRAVVKQDVATMQKYFGDDFYFKHSTGQIDSKESWVTSIKNLKEGNRFTSREHDSTEVELHGDVAIVAGKLSVAREAQPQVRKYYLTYIRVFALRNKTWQLISHRSTKEWH